ncbi:MAG: histidinol-phosphate transaminase [Mogibacterium sp.]|nr:histidinol-phosphate transaminase [Mogibacterium sp.]
MSRYIRDRYKGFASYTPGEQPKDTEYIKLNTNESPFPPAPGVIRALKETDLERLRLYPDPTGSRLKKKIAAFYSVQPENVFLTNGSDDILNFAVMAYGDEDDTFVFPDITYSFYDVIAELHGVKYERIPLKEDMTVDWREYCGIGKNIILPNPNAPTGCALKLAEIEEIVRTNPDNVVLIDEAYVDFGAESAIPLIGKDDNLLVSHTVSRFRSFAGGRLGYAIADAGLIGDLVTMQYSTNPYNVNSLSLLLAEAAFDEDSYYRANADRIKENRAYTTEQLRSLGFDVVPSLANFVFAKHRTVSGDTIYQELKKRGVLVRHFTAERIRDYNRITIGTKEQMDVLLQKLQEIIEPQQ